RSESRGRRFRSAGKDLGTTSQRMLKFSGIQTGNSSHKGRSRAVDVGIAIVGAHRLARDQIVVEDHMESGLNIAHGSPGANEHVIRTDLEHLEVARCKEFLD